MLLTVGKNHRDNGQSVTYRTTISYNTLKPKNLQFIICEETNIYKWYVANYRIKIYILHK